MLASETVFKKAGNVAFAIMRCTKLATGGSLAASLSHCYRERETHNADDARTPKNTHFGASSSSDALTRMRELWPEKRRKDAVLAVEYLFTASPEWWETTPPEQRAEFFRRSVRWLKEKYGSDRVVTATVHRDETSPHLSAFVVPLTADGRLSAKEFVGNRRQLADDQTSFANTVADLGLSRGIEGSQATHETIASYYGKIKNKPPENVSKTLLGHVRHEDYLKVENALEAYKIREKAIKDRESRLTVLTSELHERQKQTKHDQDLAARDREWAIQARTYQAERVGELVMENNRLKVERTRLINENQSLRSTIHEMKIALEQLNPSPDDRGYDYD